MKKINIYINNDFQCAILIEEEITIKEVLDQVQDAFDPIIWDQNRVSDNELIISIPDYEVTYKAA